MSFLYKIFPDIRFYYNHDACWSVQLVEHLQCHKIQYFYLAFVVYNILTFKKRKNKTEELCHEMALHNVNSLLSCPFFSDRIGLTSGLKFVK